MNGLTTFDSVAQVCGWDDGNKLKWLRVHLAGRAGTTYRRLPDDVKTDFNRATAAVRGRFEPDNKKELYRAELLACKKRMKGGQYLEKTWLIRHIQACWKKPKNVLTK